MCSMKVGSPSGSPGGVSSESGGGQPVNQQGQEQLENILKISSKAGMQGYSSGVGGAQGGMGSELA